MVSIPQSGLQAFRRISSSPTAVAFPSFNPSIGLTSVPTTVQLIADSVEAQFQSLNRAYKRSDLHSHGRANSEYCFNPSIGLTSVPTISFDGSAEKNAEFQSLNRAYKRSDDSVNFASSSDDSSFNPSIGLTSVPTQSEPIPGSMQVAVSIPQSGLQAFRLCKVTFSHL